MRKKQLPDPQTAGDMLPKKSEISLEDYILGLPPGTKISDIVIDMQDLATQLKFSKRTINNMRKAGKISHTFLEEKGKVFFFNLEFMAILINNAVIGKNSPLKKQGFVKSVTTFTGLFSLLPFDIEALAAVACIA